MYRKAAKGWMKHFDFMILDMVCLSIAYLTAGYVRINYSNFWEYTEYRNLFVVLLLVNIIVICNFSTLKNVLKRDYCKELILTLRHVCVVMLMGAFYLFITKTGIKYSRIVFVLTGVLYFLTGYLSRSLWKNYLISQGVLLAGRKSLLIVTTKDLLGGTIQAIKKHNFGRYYVIGVTVIDADMVGLEVDNIKVVATLETTAEYVCHEWIDGVFIKLSREAPLCKDLIEKLMQMGVPVHLSLDELDKLTDKKQSIERIGPYMVITSSMNMTTVGASLTKRFLDICGALLGCLLTAVLTLILAPLIYIKSPGPIFFSQIRVGQNGKTFKIYKFRSMYLDAEKRKNELMEKNRVSNNMMFKLEYDPRIIGCEPGSKKGIGNFIRKYSIDEFPQFWNVLKGDMSLVGVRPPTIDEWERYAIHHRVRLAIKPGITGMWQVSGRSNITDFEEVVRLDTCYITDWSVWLDMKIIAKTFKVVLKQNGAM